MNLIVIAVLAVWLGQDVCGFKRAPIRRTPLARSCAPQEGSLDIGAERSIEVEADNNDIFAPIIGIGNSDDNHDMHLKAVETEMENGQPPDLFEREQWIARATLLLVAAVYGTNFSCVKLLGEALDPSLASLLRFSIAGLVFSPYLLEHFNKNRKLIMGGVEVGLYSAAGYYGQAVSLHSTPASTAAFICSLAVIVVPLLDMLSSMFNTKGGSSSSQKSNAMIPAVIAALGVAVLELGGDSSPGAGDLWAFAQPLFFGLGFWRVESFMHDTKDGEPQAFTGAMMSTVAFASLLWAGAECFWPAYQSGGLSGVETVLGTQLGACVADWHVLAAILWTGVVTTAFTSYGENSAMKTLTSAETTVIFSTEPLWGTAFAAYAFNEAVGANTFIGAFFILVACAYSSVGPTITLPTLLSTGQLLTGGLLFEEETGSIFENVFSNFNRIVDDMFGGSL